MADKGQITEGMVNRDAMREAAAAALRVDPIKLLAQGKESSFTSRIVASDDGHMKIETTDNKAARSGHPTPKSTMAIEGTSSVGGIINTNLNSDFTITNSQGNSRQTMKAQFSLSGSNFDAAFGDYQISKRSLTLTDTAGRILQSYEPAKYIMPAGKVDANGQPVRLAQAADKSNCGWESNTSPAKGVQCVSMLHDSQMGNFGYYQTSTKNGSLEYRSVLRDQQGGVLGIVDQTFTQDGRIITTARKPAHTK